ncbi:NADPH-dependent FMN reductase [Streptomyces sp. ODS28]|uniref:NADPH-dependent FMN reductase n=1 Tax=Streptomyces sp. ODS28 TaxID=3136688 RepID=UPI0031ED9852
MSHVLTVSGSPSAHSRTAALLRYIERTPELAGHEVRRLCVPDLPPGPLLRGETGHPALRSALAAIARADALVIGTPVYQAAYSGALKTLLDVVPEAGLSSKTVLPLATGGTPAHLLALDYALRPVLTALGCDRVLRGRFVLDRHITPDPVEGARLEQDTAAGVHESVGRLARALGEPAAALSAAAAPR